MELIHIVEISPGRAQGAATTHCTRPTRYGTDTDSIYESISSRFLSDAPTREPDDGESGQQQQQHCMMYGCVRSRSRTSQTTSGLYVSLQPCTRANRTTARAARRPQRGPGSLAVIGYRSSITDVCTRRLFDDAPRCVSVRLASPSATASAGSPRRPSRSRLALARSRP